MSEKEFDPRAPHTNGADRKSDLESMAEKYGVIPSQQGDGFHKPQDAPGAPKQARKQAGGAAAQASPAPKKPNESSSKKKESGFVRFLKGVLPWKGDSILEMIRKIVLMISVITLLVCGVYFANRAIQRHRSQSDTAEWSDLINDQTGETLSFDDAKAAYPNVDFPEGMQAKFYKLYATNPDFVGWLSIPNTNISQPVLQAADNDYYLRRDLNRIDTEYGSPFLDFRNKIQPLSRNSIVYGHYMRDNLIFAKLKDYIKPGGFQKAPLIQFDTLFEDTQWKIYGAFITNAESAEDNGYAFDYLTTGFRSDEQFMEFIDQIDQRRLYDTGVDIQPTDKIITLSTCYPDFHEARLVVVGRQVRPGESAEVDTSKVKTNPSPRYPQVWYDKKSQQNPYKDAEKWVVS